MKSKQPASLAVELLAMSREQFYNWVMGGTNATGEKRRKKLMELIASTLPQASDKPKKKGK